MCLKINMHDKIVYSQFGVSMNIIVFQLIWKQSNVGQNLTREQSVSVSDLSSLVTNQKLWCADGSRTIFLWVKGLGGYKTDMDYTLVRFEPNLFYSETNVAI